MRTGGGEDVEQHKQKLGTRKDFCVEDQVHAGTGDGKVAWGQSKKRLNSPNKFNTIL